MARKSGGKLRPDTREKQRKQPLDSRVLKVLNALNRKGLLATQGAFNRLSRWLGYMAKGSTVDYRTPFFAKRKADGHLQYTPREEITDRFKSILQTVDYGSYPATLGEYSRSIDEDELGKIGPMSPFESWFKDGPRKAEAVFSDKPQLSGFDSKAWQRALNRIAAFIDRGSCERSSVEDAIAGVADDPNTGMDTTTNSGDPYWIRVWKPSATTSGRKNLEDGDNSETAFRYYVEESKRLISTLNAPVPERELPYLWATASQRLVQKGPEPFLPKSKRLVEAYGKYEAIVGKTMSPAIMDKLREVRFPGGTYLMCAWSDLPTIDSNMQHMLEYANQHKLVVNSGDISNFDATVPPWALWDVVQAIAPWVRGGEHLLRNMGYMMIYKTILITPSGFYGPGPSSMKSGSWSTNLLGSMTNLAIQLYGEELGLYKIACVCVLGDDFVAVGEGVNPENTARAFAAFGMEAHPDKQFYHPDALHFLQRLHYRGYPGGIASISRTLGSCLSLERLSVKPSEWNSYAYIVQAASKLNNAVFHPGFKELVDFVASGDRYQLGAKMSPQDVLTGAGDAGLRILKENEQHSWKRTGDNLSFVNWAVNGVLRGEVLPPLGIERFKRVYGREPSLTRG